MKLYSDIPGRRAVQVAADVGDRAVGGALGARRPAGATTRRWRWPSPGATSPAPGSSFRDTMSSAGDNVDDLPLLDDRVATPFRSAAGVGTEIEKAGTDLVTRRRAGLAAAGA